MMNALFGTVAAAAVVPAAVAFPIATEVDPIFGHIAMHRAAQEAYARAMQLEGDAVVGPELETASAVTRAAGRAASDLFWELLHVQPRSLAGAAALLDHLAQPEFPHEEGSEYWRCRDTLLTTWNNCEDRKLRRAAQDFPLRLAAALRDIAAMKGGEPAFVEQSYCVRSTSSADAVLIELGRQFEILYAQSLEAEAGAKFDRVTELSNPIDLLRRQIESTTPHTLMGLAIKVRAAAYYAADLWDDSDENDWTGQMARDLAEHICAVAGAPHPRQPWTDIPPSAVPIEPDPIFAAIAEHRVARAHLLEVTDEEGDAPGEAHKRHDDAFVAVFATRPTTYAGVVAVMAYVSTRIDNEADSGDDQHSILVEALDWESTAGIARDFTQNITDVLRGLGRADSRSAAPIEPDPIFAVIERHRTAFGTLGDRCSDLDQADTPAAEAELAALHEAVTDTEDDLREVWPVTTDGAVALLRYVDALAREGHPLDELLDADNLADALENIAA
jgi:hypothetical protein